MSKRATRLQDGFIFSCRFTSATAAYCISVSTAATGTTPGTITIIKRTAGGGGTTTLATAPNLAITVGTWHTYKLKISGAGPVTLDAFLDGVATATASDSTAPYTAGAVALSVRNATVDFDDLVVTTP